MAGTIPNRKSTPVIDEWFGLRYVNGQFSEELTMEQVISETGYGRSDVLINALTETIGKLHGTSASVVSQAEKVLKDLVRIIANE